MAEKGLGFRVLGPLQASVDGMPVSLGTPKQRAVLAMLVINRNRPVGIDSLITAAWEQLPPPNARASLHSYVSNLRRLLGGVGVDSRPVLVSAPPGYRLSVADVDCDIGQFVIEKNAGVQAAAAGRFEEASRPPVGGARRVARSGARGSTRLCVRECVRDRAGGGQSNGAHRPGRGRNRVRAWPCRHRRPGSAGRRASVS